MLYGRFSETDISSDSLLIFLILDSLRRWCSVGGIKLAGLEHRGGLRGQSLQENNESTGEEKWEDNGGRHTIQALAQHPVSVDVVDGDEQEENIGSFFQGTCWIAWIGC